MRPRAAMRRFRAGLLAATLLFAGAPRAQFSVARVDGGTLAAGGANLVLDDGTGEIAVGLSNNGEFLWFNQFSPPASHFPLRITEVEVLFASAGGVAVGDTFDVHLYSSTPPYPTEGAVVYLGGLVGLAAATVDAFDVRTLPEPLLVAAPADILIGVVNRGMDGPEESPAAMDTDSSMDRSWIAVYDEGDPPQPPPIPTRMMALAAHLDLPGNWMIRGTYVSESTAAQEGPERRFRLHPAVPNPARASATVVFDLDTPSPVRVSLLDILGREVLVLSDGVRPVGRHEVSFDGRRVPPGTYLVRLVAGGHLLTQRITFAR